MPKKWTEYAVTGHMLKRLAQLHNHAGEKCPANRMHNHGTSMGSLKFRGLATSCGPSCCNITEGGEDCLAQARAEGW